MTNEKYKIKGGQKEFEEYYRAVKVAEIKAESSGKPVTVCKKTLKNMEELVKILPKGSQIEL